MLPLSFSMAISGIPVVKLPNEYRENLNNRGGQADSTTVDKYFFLCACFLTKIMLPKKNILFVMTNTKVSNKKKTHLSFDQ